MFFVIIIIDYRIEGVDKMNFSLDWFLTVPGMFITGGVLLLIIALVILIVTGKKSKKEKAAANADVSATDPNAMAAQGGPQPTMVAPGVPVGDPAMAVQPEMVAQPVGVAPVDPMAAAPVVDPTMMAQPEMVAQPVEAMSVDAMAAPVVDPTMMAQPEVAPVAPVVPNAEPVIYGGASPAVTGINVNQDTNHQIYGGADPLQNTQTIPNVVPVAPTITEPVMVAQPTPEVASVQPGVVPVAPINPTQQ